MAFGFAPALFPDTTVLCTFAIWRLGLLEEFVDGQGAWTQAVYLEVRRSQRSHAALSAVTDLRRGWMGAPIEVVEADRVEDLRVGTFGGSVYEPGRHLGEAETCHLLSSDPSCFDAVWITDDHSAYDYAVHRGIETLDTHDVVRGLVGRGRLDASGGYDLFQQMREAGRHPRRSPGGPEDLLGSG